MTIAATVRGWGKIGNCPTSFCFHYEVDHWGESMTMLLACPGFQSCYDLLDSIISITFDIKPETKMDTGYKR